MWEMQNIEARDLKMFCDMAESSHTNKATTRTSKTALVGAHPNQWFSSGSSEILKQTNKIKQEQQKQQQNPSSSRCLVVYFHVSDRSQWLSVGFSVEIYRTIFLPGSCIYWLFPPPAPLSLTS